MTIYDDESNNDDTDGDNNDSDDDSASDNQSDNDEDDNSHLLTKAITYVEEGRAMIPTHFAGASQQPTSDVRIDLRR
jgi:hypothetical protein